MSHNQFTPKAERQSRRAVSVKLSEAELATIDRGAARYHETRSETIRLGALARARSTDGAEAGRERYMCQYCSTYFETRAAAEAHIDAKH